jgi:hypothetical protein
MRFKEFLTEGSKFNLEKFKTDCAFTLDQLKGSAGKYLMYRGQPAGTKDWEITAWKGRTEPRNTPKIAHTLLNDFFTKKFGAPVRNWMFATGRKDTAQTYSGVQPIDIIFPIGKFEWVSCSDPDLYDLTIALNHQRWRINAVDVDNKISYDEKNELAANALIKSMDAADWYHNTDLVDAIKAEGEIMFKCSRFYQFSLYGAVWKSEEMEDFIHSL